jgi:hypothetical protein
MYLDDYDYGFHQERIVIPIDYVKYQKIQFNKENQFCLFTMKFGSLHIK